MGAPRKLVKQVEESPPAVRLNLVSAIGSVKRRRDGRVYLDFRPTARLYSFHGVPLRDEETANLLLDQIRGSLHVGQGLEDLPAAAVDPLDRPAFTTNSVADWRILLAFLS